MKTVSDADSKLNGFLSASRSPHKASRGILKAVPVSQVGYVGNHVTGKYCVVKCSWDQTPVRAPGFLPRISSEAQSSVCSWNVFLLLGIRQKVACHF